MRQLTGRDEAMLDWMNVVRLADVDAIRWALSAYQDDHDDGPVSIRRANHWIARMAELGYLGRARPMYRDRQIVWPTHQATGRAAPRLFRQTMRHELAVAMVSGRYLAAGYEWARDRRPQPWQDHQADGVATKGRAVELIEVELTVKKRSRYQRILAHYGSLLEAGAASAVRYICTQDVAAFVSREADHFMFRVTREQLTTAPIFDGQGRMAAETPFADMTGPSCNNGVNPADSV